MYFKASLDKLAKTLPMILIVFSLVVFLTLFFAIKDAMHFIFFYPLFILLGVSIGTYLFSPRGYEVFHDRIEIIRPINRFIIPRSDIAHIQPLSNNDMGKVWRMAGNGGMYGYTGYFTSKAQGSMRWFVSQRKNYVLLTLRKRGKIVLSPDDILGFIAATLS